MTSPAPRLGHSRSSKALFLGTALGGVLLVGTPLVLSMRGTHDVAEPSTSVSATASASASARASVSAVKPTAPPRPVEDEVSPPWATLSPSPSPDADPTSTPVPDRRRVRIAAAAPVDRPAPTPTPRPQRPGPAASPTTRPSPQWTRTVVHGTSVLTPGQSWSTNRVTLAFQRDGNLVLRDHDGTPRWQSGTAGRGATTVFQADGNLVVYTSDRATAWSSRTDGHDGAQLVLGTDGTVSVRAGGSVLWSVGS